MTEADTKKAAAEASVNWRTIIIVCITGLSVVTVGGVVVIAVFGADSGLALVIQILSFVIMIVGFLLGLLKIEQVHQIVNAKSTAQDEKIHGLESEVKEFKRLTTKAEVALARVEGPITPPMEVIVADSSVTLPVKIEDPGAEK